uniref:Uncharacterized protein n=1 Tax=Daphnia magna TaxID=35525 RepID=A0A0P6BKX4_9CRUS
MSKQSLLRITLPDLRSALNWIKRHARPISTRQYHNFLFLFSKHILIDSFVSSSWQLECIN